MGTDGGILEDARLGVPGHVLARRAAAETVLLNLENEEYYGLDGVGTRLWQLIEAGTTFGAAVAALVAEYDVERERLLADLVALVTDLRVHGLVLIDAS